MILGVTGGRKYSDRDKLFGVMNWLYKSLDVGETMIVVHGNAPGADSLAADWIFGAQANGWDVQEIRIPAAWDGPRKRGAGFARNAVIAKVVATYPSKRRGAIAFPGNNGTKHAVECYENEGVLVHRVDW